ncbi:MAG: hypothetical protein H6Q26_2578 [Bacteroidetes bacterium]|nr:hypothetical protein [Bacteroidota bacterium]
MKEEILQRGMKTIFKENIHEKWNSPTKMKPIFKEKGSGIIPPPLIK